MEIPQTHSSRAHSLLHLVCRKVRSVNRQQHHIHPYETILPTKSKVLKAFWSSNHIWGIERVIPFSAVCRKQAIAADKHSLLIVCANGLAGDQWQLYRYTSSSSQTDRPKRCTQHGSSHLNRLVSSSEYRGEIFIHIRAQSLYSKAFFSSSLASSTSTSRVPTSSSPQFPGSPTSSSYKHHPRLYLLGDFPVGVPPSAPRYSHVNQRVTVCLMLMAARCLVRHLFRNHCASRQQQRKEKEKMTSSQQMSHRGICWENTIGRHKETKIKIWQWQIHLKPNWLSQTEFIKAFTTGPCRLLVIKIKCIQGNICRVLDTVIIFSGEVRCWDVLNYGGMLIICIIIIPCFCGMRFLFLTLEYMVFPLVSHSFNTT